MQAISESLAGRVALVEVAPFSMSEAFAQPLSGLYELIQSRRLSRSMAEKQSPFSQAVDAELCENLPRTRYFASVPQFAARKIPAIPANAGAIIEDNHQLLERSADVRSIRAYCARLF